MHASEVTHTKMAYQVWHEDPPSSSYPACIAVKTAALQSNKAGEQYLLKIRSAIMSDGRNISKPEVLLDVAEELDSSTLDFQQFKEDWTQGKGKEPFRADLQKASYHKIGRYPTLTFQNPQGKGIIITGYRPYEILEQAYSRIANETGDE
jgi:predicted DsbA family dithiol-disulfide isomerase